MQQSKKHNRSPLTVESLEQRQLMAAFAVTNLNDAGAGSLRWAIESANNTTAADTVSFNVAGSGAKTIKLKSPLPSIDAPLTIDGTTQKGYASTPVIHIDGSAFAEKLYQKSQPGLSVMAKNSVIKGLSITGFGQAGVQFVNDVADGSRLEKSFVGIRPDGSTHGNRGDGVVISADNVTLADNTIAGNGRHGIYIHNDVGRVAGAQLDANVIGLKKAGNGSVGLWVEGADRTLVGAARQNTISNNKGGGVVLKDAPYTEVYNNHIGVSVLGGNAEFNGGSRAILVEKSPNVRIGQAHQGNVIAGQGVDVIDSKSIRIHSNTIGVNAYGHAGNDMGGYYGLNLSRSISADIRFNSIGNVGTGISFYKSGSAIVLGNAIGTLRSDASAVAPVLEGITISQSSSNQIGQVGAGNVIKNASGRGVWMISGKNNQIRGNTFQNNGQMDIDIGSVGTNKFAHPYDSATKSLPNEGVNAPIAEWAVNYGNEVTVGFRTPEGGILWNTVDVYASPTQKLNGTGEGRVYLGTYSLQGHGNTRYATFNASLDSSWYISATMTNATSNTSEFSKARKLQDYAHIKSSSFQFDQKHAVRYVFSQDVFKSLNSSDVKVTNTKTGKVHTPDYWIWHKSLNAADFIFKNQLPDGNYQAVLNAKGVHAGVASNHLHTFNGREKVNFFTLAGDVNRDRKVDYADLTIVGNNLGKQGRLFSQGNANYDVLGKVDSLDSLVVINNFGKTV